MRERKRAHILKMKKFSLIRFSLFLSFSLIFIFSLPAKIRAQVIWPTKYTNVTSCFGWRCFDEENPFNPLNYHTGIDISSDQDTGVFSATPGRVTRVVNNCEKGDSSCGHGYGNYVIIEDDYAHIETLYAHLASVNVSKGDYFDGNGVSIGTMGNTGNSKGTHLHFEVYINSVLDGVLDGVRVDPLLHLALNWNVAEGQWCRDDIYPKNGINPYKSAEEACGGKPGLVDPCKGVPIPPPDLQGCSLHENIGNIFTRSESSNSLIWTGYRRISSGNNVCGGEIQTHDMQTRCWREFKCTCTCTEDGITKGCGECSEDYYDSYEWAPTEEGGCLNQPMDDGKAPATKPSCSPWQTITTIPNPILTTEGTPEAPLYSIEGENSRFSPWVALKAQGDCGPKIFSGSLPLKKYKDKYGQDEYRSVYQSVPLACACWGHCLTAVNDYHYYDGKGELPKTEKIKLPVLLGWKMPLIGSYDYKRYWNEPTGVYSVDTQIGDRGHFLTGEKLLDNVFFNGTDKTNKERLNDYISGCLDDPLSDGEAMKFANFLKILGYPVGYTDLGGLRDRILAICRDYEEVTKNPDISDSIKAQLKRQYKLQRLNQILYFVYFSSGNDVIGKPKEVTLGDDIFLYSPTQAKKTGFGPCTLPSDKYYDWRAQLCCGKNSSNCGPIKETNFTTDKAPEPVGIVEATIKDNGWPKPSTILMRILNRYSNQVNDIPTNIPEYLIADAKRWIDTDWNGADKVIIKDRDYVDFEWCAVKKESFLERQVKYFSTGPPYPYYKVRMFYTDKLKLFEPSTAKVEEKKANLIAREKNLPPKCEDQRQQIAEDICGYPENALIQQCLCPKAKDPNEIRLKDRAQRLACGEYWLKDVEVCYPGSEKRGAPRLEWNIKDKNYNFGKDNIADFANWIDKMSSPEFKNWKKETLQPIVEGNCLGIATQGTYNIKLAKYPIIALQEEPYRIQHSNGIEYQRGDWDPEETKEWIKNVLDPAVKQAISDVADGKTPRSISMDRVFSMVDLGDSWFWDYQSQLLAYHMPISWQVGTIATAADEGQNREPASYSQKWDFQIEKWPIRKWDKDEQKMVNIKPIGEISLNPLSPSNTVEETPEPGSPEILAVNRLQNFVWKQIERSLSYRLTFFSGTNPATRKALAVPTEFSFVRTPTEEETYWRKFTFHKVWPFLKNPNMATACYCDEARYNRGECKNPGFSNPNCMRIQQNFSVDIEPCWDEWQENCSKTKNSDSRLGFSQKFQVTGSMPGNLYPGVDGTETDPLPDPIPELYRKIPRTLQWDDMPGAASYWYKISLREEATAATTPISTGITKKSELDADLRKNGYYYYKIKTCADDCDEKDQNSISLQCGTSHTKVFYGCRLDPPTNVSPKSGQQFLSTEVQEGGEPIALSWDKIPCKDAPELYYEYKVKYSNPVDCQKIKKVLRQKCEDIQASPECKNLLDDSTVVLPHDSRDPDPVHKTYLIKSSNSDTSPISLPPFSLKCLGGYTWEMRACLVYDWPSNTCWKQEAGAWSSLGYFDGSFNVVLEKSAQLPQGGSGFGTCQDLIPSCNNGCTAADLPKIAVGLIANVINCILWTLFPLGLFGLVLYTGIVFYFALGAPETLERVKLIWKAGGKGFLWMFFAWTILNIIFQVLGWQKGTFGDWFNPH